MRPTYGCRLGFIVLDTPLTFRRGAWTGGEPVVVAVAGGREEASVLLATIYVSLKLTLATLKSNLLELLKDCSQSGEGASVASVCRYCNALSSAR